MISKTYGIIGNGRLATHLVHFFRMKQMQVVQWHRGLTRPLDQVLLHADIILILINDDEIEPFIKKTRWLAGKTLIHCSGNLVTKHAQGFHPHFNFTHHLYKEETYDKIPFVIEKGRNNFFEIFPQLSNPHFEIAKKHKPLYHALCVMSGNFPTLIWQSSSSLYAKKLKLPPTFFTPYIQNCVDQFAQDPQGSLTGPLVRNDKKTIQKNIQALKGSPLQPIYKMFVKQYSKMKKN